MNVFSFTGNLGDDCKRATTQGGKSVCEFSVAVKSGYGDNQSTTWVSCVMFGKRAEGKLPDYLVKGQAVAVSGEAKLEKWEGGAKIKVLVGSVDLIGEKKSEGQPKQQPQPQPQQASMDDNFDDDIPFS